MHFIEFHHCKQVLNSVFSGASVVPTSQFDMDAILILLMTGIDKIPGENFHFFYCEDHLVGVHDIEFCS
jgi:hypothetical protein